MANSYDFSGWATRNDLRCSDGRTIRKDAFKHNDGQTVPLVWNHRHNEIGTVLGHALLENRNEGVYAYCTLNDTEAGRTAKELVIHGDVNALSIYANQLKQNGGDVLHGAIREVSLVLAGANPGALIDSVIAHGEESEEEAIIYTGEYLSLKHSEEEKVEEKPAEDAKPEEPKEEEKKMAEEIKHADAPAEESGKEETVKDVWDTLSEKQKTVVYAIIGAAMKEKGGSSDEGETEVKHNVFDNDEMYDDSEVISHSDMMAVINDSKRFGSMRESALQHGIENIDYLFPDAQTLEKTPGFISRRMDWVDKVMNGAHHSPFSRVKSIYANITADEARARGYIKGKKKVEEVFPLLKRSTEPQTVYKKQKFDRDDVIDITDFDVVSWVKSEMRVMLDEEIARAILIGDGRLSGSDDKIDETHIRPIATDDSTLYTIQKTVTTQATDDATYRLFIQEAIKARKEYKGTGTPTLFCTEDTLTGCLLIEDLNKRIVYDSVDKLATALRVKEIVTVPVMEGAKDASGNALNLMGIIVNMADYNVGADKGGAVAMFDDFDIDYNQQKYLIETRCSGALTTPFSAIVIKSAEAE